MGGIRQQFCTAVTVQMVQHSVAFWKEFDERMGTPERAPRAWFRQRGYLFLADAATAPALMRRYELERRAGARVQTAGARRDAAAGPRRLARRHRASACSGPRTDTRTRAKC